jgi:hypothetical protein
MFNHNPSPTTPKSLYSFTGGGGIFHHHIVHPVIFPAVLCYDVTKINNEIGGDWCETPYESIEYAGITG